MSARHVVIVGGGVAGLTAAHRLVTNGVTVTVLDADDRLGGKLCTDELLGHAVDRGADSFLARLPYAGELCRELGLEDEFVTPAVRTALLLVEGRLHPFPAGLMLGVPTDLDALSASGIVSDEGIARAALDLERPGTPPTGDLSVGALVRPRLGDEIFEKLVSPLLSGINAGDADELSVEAGTPQLALAARDGSLIAGARRQLASTDPDAPVFFSLRGGTGRLVDALESSITEEAATGTISRNRRVTSVAKSGGRWHVVVDDGSSIDCDAVLLATPAFVTSSLVAPFAPDAAAGLAALAYASVALVTFAYRRQDVGHALDASGFLVATRPDDDMLMTACSFGSSKWPHWADSDTVVLRVSAGRHHDQRALALDDTALVDALRTELDQVLATRGEPLAVDVRRWLQALPQYRPGHLARVESWHDEVGRAGGVALAGAAYGGVGIPACIAGARTAADRLLD